MDFLAVEHTVGAREVHELEEAQSRVDPLSVERVHAAVAVGVDDDHLARLDLAHEVRADRVKGRGLGGEHPPVIEPAEAQRAEAVGIAHADEMGLVHQHQRERAFEAGQHLRDCELEVATIAARVGRIGAGDQLGHQIAVAAARVGTGEHRQLAREGLGVGEVAVVADRESRLTVGGRADRAIHRLRVAPCARTRRRVPRVADGKVTLQSLKLERREHVGDETHVLVDGDHVAVADGHSGRLLPAMLQGVEAVKGQMGDRLARCVDAEDATSLFGGVVVIHQRRWRVGSGEAARHAGKGTVWPPPT